MIKGVTECPYWTLQDYEMVWRARSFEWVADVAIRVLERMPSHIVELCGPISTGGLGCPNKNLLVFQRCVHELRLRGLNPFDQCPLQIGIDILAAEWKRKNGN